LIFLSSNYRKFLVDAQEFTNRRIGMRQGQEP
jgi:hypothetical protein